MTQGASLVPSRFRDGATFAAKTARSSGLADAARSLDRAGADFLVLCTNTMHIVAEQIEAATPLPLLHIADATATGVRAAGLTCIGLLGTRFTMEEAFYRGRLEERHGLRVVVPPAADRAVVHRVIYDELCRGRVDEGSRREYQRIVGGLVVAGAEGVILGCTEMGASGSILLRQSVWSRLERRMTFRL